MRSGGTGSAGHPPEGTQKLRRAVFGHFRTSLSRSRVLGAPGCQRSVGCHIHLPSFSPLWRINILIDPGKIIEPAGAVTSSSAKGINVQTHSQTPAFLITKIKRLSQICFAKQTKLTSLSPGPFWFQPSNSQTLSFPGNRVVTRRGLAWGCGAPRLAGTQALALPETVSSRKALESSGLVNVR